jgi:ubiquinone/menaquinone biosynthesis C-methylase UbiE
MTMQLSGKEIRKKIIEDYYSSIYDQAFKDDGTLSFGIKYFYRFLEKSWGGADPAITEYSKILELGAGNGEFWPHLKQLPGSEYIALDLRPLSDDRYLKSMSQEFQDKFLHVVGNAQNIPFKDNYFDRSFSSCLLHHVEEPIEVLMEVRRVTKVGGEIIFAMPSDPGFLNQILKHLFTYRKMKRFSRYEPALFYALDHPNHVKALMTLIEFVFQEDELNFRYSPFRFPSWNFNLIVLARVRKKSSDPKYIL